MKISPPGNKLLNQLQGPPRLTREADLRHCLDHFGGCPSQNSRHDLGRHLIA